jgi:hypothetical protein
VFEDVSERKAQELALRRDAETLAWLDRVQTALAEDRFVLHAQTIMDTHTEEVVQHELLLRVREPDGAIVGLGRHLQVAEQYGLIGEIDRWVIGEAARIAATRLPVQVNISARSIVDPTILEQIERCVRRYDTDPRLMVFEITETAVIVGEAAARFFAQRLRDLGCGLAWTTSAPATAASPTSSDCPSTFSRSTSNSSATSPSAHPVARARRPVRSRVGAQRRAAACIDGRDQSPVGGHPRASLVDPGGQAAKKHHIGRRQHD